MVGRSGDCSYESVRSLGGLRLWVGLCKDYVGGLEGSGMVTLDQDGSGGQLFESWDVWDGSRLGWNLDLQFWSVDVEKREKTGKKVEVGSLSIGNWV